jgi:hypothetical protein
LRECGASANIRGVSQGNAETYAQWRDTSQALDWTEKAYQLKDPGILGLAVDGFVDPLRKEPRFQRIPAQLNIPN